MVEAKDMSVHPRIFLHLFISLLCGVPGYVMACNEGQHCWSQFSHSITWVLGITMNQGPRSWWQVPLPAESSS